MFGLFCREHARALATPPRRGGAGLAGHARRPDFRVFQLTDEVEDGLRTLRVRYRRPRLRPLALVCQLLGMLAAAAAPARARAGAPTWCTPTSTRRACPRWLLGAPGAARRWSVTEHYTGFQRGLVTGDERLAGAGRLRARRPGGAGEPGAGRPPARDRARAPGSAVHAERGGHRRRSRPPTRRATTAAPRGC